MGGGEADEEGSAGDGSEGGGEAHAVGDNGGVGDAGEGEGEEGVVARVCASTAHRSYNAIRPTSATPTLASSLCTVGSLVLSTHERAYISFRGTNAKKTKGFSVCICAAVCTCEHRIWCAVVEVCVECMDANETWTMTISAQFLPKQTVV